MSHLPDQDAGSDSDSEDGVLRSISRSAMAEEAKVLTGPEDNLRHCKELGAKINEAMRAHNEAKRGEAAESKMESMATLWLEERPPSWNIVEEGKLDLADDPLEAVADNDRHRRADVPDGVGSGLWTVDQWKAASPRVYRFGLPTFAPPRWGPAHTIGQLAYSQKFASEFPEICDILPMRNVCVAGGAAAWPLGDSASKASDIDFFVYGLSAEDTEEGRVERWGCVSALVDRIRARFVQCVEIFTPGLITIKATRKNSEVLKLQIILRAYSTVSSILHGFDVPSCCVAYDGYVAVMTRLSAYAHMFRANVVVPAYRSTSYESRLLKYFGRGYALVMPHLNAKLLVRGVVLELPNLILTPAVVRGRFASGAAALSRTQPESDYDMAGGQRSTNRRWGDLWKGLYGQNYTNLRMLAAGRPFVMFGVATDRPIRSRRRRRDQSEAGETGLPFRTFWDEPTLEAVFPPEHLARTLTAIAQAVVSTSGRVNIRNLYKIFGLNDDQVSRLVNAVADAQDKNPGQRVGVMESLIPFADALVGKFKALPAKIDWWILTNPTKQYTASFNPRYEDPKQWYGAAFDGAIAPPTSDEALETMIGVFEGRIHMRDVAGGAVTVFDGLCPICHGDVRSGDINSVTLPCGHVFHWAPLPECGGLYGWTDSGHNTCPACRFNFIDVMDIEEPARTIAIDIVL